LGKDITLLQ
jgi:hypothetical protein